MDLARAPPGLHTHTSGPRSLKEVAQSDKYVGPQTQPGPGLVREPRALCLAEDSTQPQKGKASWQQLRVSSHSLVFLPTVPRELQEPLLILVSALLSNCLQSLIIEVLRVHGVNV